MKVLFLGNIQKNHVQRWARSLASRNHEVVVVSDKPADGITLPKSVQVIQPEWNFWQNLLVYKIQGGRFANNLHKWRVIKPIVEQVNPDLIHAHEALVNGPTLAHFNRYPRVLTPWGPDMELLEGTDHEARELVLQAIGAADVISTNAPGLENHWSKLAPIPPGTLSLWSWGIDMGIFRRVEADRRTEMYRRLDIKLDTPILLSPRLAKPYYQLDRIIAAWRSVKADEKPSERLASAMLVILRAGATDADWALVCEQATGDSSIRLVDESFKAPEMAALYSIAHATIMMPRTDLLSMSLLEAMACGSIPIVEGLPCDRTALVDPTPKPPFNRGIGILSGTSEVAAIREALLRWGQLCEGEAITIGQHNAAYVSREHDAVRCEERLLEDYMLAIGRFAARKSRLAQGKSANK